MSARRLTAAERRRRSSILMDVVLRHGAALLREEQDPSVTAAISSAAVDLAEPAVAVAQEIIAIAARRFGDGEAGKEARTPRTPKATPTPEQYARLLAFAAQHGRLWKSHLNYLWFTGRDADEPGGHLLRQVRNTLGPSWLQRVRLCDCCPSEEVQS